MKWPILKCPFCGGRLRNTELRIGKPLVCPTCAAKLQFSTSQINLDAVVGLLLSAALAYLMGIRGVWLIATTLLFWFPVGLIWEFVSWRIIPPRFEGYVPKGYDVKKGLFGG